ncbi:GTPase IMAP family member 8-like [Genypterus blacodes]|uniref:GTPase IMAP family member 8-like n=1 Tax=Genypterus blacodes TaxID=154954 RepID=UPI003F772E08
MAGLLPAPEGNAGGRLRHSSSYNLLPPNLSELRVVLLGNNRTARGDVGNLILGQTEFDSEEAADRCQKVNGRFKDKDVVVINTPDLLCPHISKHTLTQHVNACVRFCDPGPHVFLLVLQPEDFTEEHKVRLYRVLETFSGRSFLHSLIVMAPTREKNYIQHPPMKELIKECSYRYLKLENLERPELLTRLGQIVKENHGEHVSCEMFEHEDQVESGLIIPSFNLVLFGRRGAEKTSVAKAILGETERPSASSHCVKHQAVVGGRRVSLVELPALYGKAQEEVMEESLRSISLCEPEGIHAFILVLPLGPLTDEDKTELETIKKTFSSAVNDLTIILFTVESDPTAPAVVNFVERNKDLQQLLQRCGGRHVLHNTRDKQQICKVLDAVDQIRSAGGGVSFTMEMFARALMEKVSRLKAESPECLRIMLLGTNGSAKSTTANTILGKDLFTSTPFFSLKNEPCQLATGKMDALSFSVVDTPGLFHEILPTDAEFKNFISALSPGPHVIFLVLQVGDITQKDKDLVEMIQQHLGKESQDFIMVILTTRDDLTQQRVDSYIKDCDDFVQTLIEAFGGRYHVINNNDQKNRRQVKDLLTKAEELVRKNGGRYCNVEKLHNIVRAKENIERILKQKEEEMQMKEDELMRGHERETQELRRRINQQRAETEQERKVKDKLQKEKEEFIKKEQEEKKRERERREGEEGKRKKQEDSQRQEWKRQLEALEKKIKSENEVKEMIEKKLEQSRRDMRREREVWEKERKELWDQRHQEDKDSLREEQTRSTRLQEQYTRSRRRWMASVCVSLCLAGVSLLYILSPANSTEGRGGL